MSFFKRLFGGSSEPDTNTPSTYLHYKRVPEFKTYLLQEQYDVFAQHYKAMAWDEQGLVIEGLTCQPELDGPVETWTRAQPDQYLAFLLQGIAMTRKAWDIRTSKLASEVTEEQAQGFFEHLALAFQALERASHLNQTDPLVPARMIPVLMGQESDTATAFSYFEAARALQPSHPGAHMSMLLYLAPKWHGSIEEMARFLDTYVDSDTYPLLTSVRLSAVFEEWTNLKLEGDEEGYKSFFADENRRAYIRGLYERFREPTDGKLLTPFVRNWFGLALLKIKEHDLASREIRAIKGKMAVSPWRMVGITSYDMLFKK
ncbi:DUF4034 domain-containing protein [Tellurirhabdus rosea]|uniref:DUF4034 domain-containing protein n=1 Tax=Tellurirhabdus rosea TaxID=2674997 RepID=UPI002250AD48|nr:DUF4034 domain-containing protein [Tellurirhabdus rosea]